MIIIFINIHIEIDLFSYSKHIVITWKERRFYMELIELNNFRIQIRFHAHGLY